MTDKTLYRYKDEHGRTVVSPMQPTGVEYELSHRLIADEGMDLINAEEVRTKCVDTDYPEEWEEIPEIPEPEPEE